MIKVRTADLQNFVRAESDSDVIEVNAYSMGATFDGGGDVGSGIYRNR